MKAKEKQEATLKISLKSDTGYSSKEEHRITINQWYQIQTILSGKPCELKLLPDQTPEQTK